MAPYSVLERSKCQGPLWQPIIWANYIPLKY